MNTSFENVKKNFGFGCIRLLMKNGEVDRKEMWQSNLKNNRRKSKWQN